MNRQTIMVKLATPVQNASIPIPIENWLVENVVSICGATTVIHCLFFLAMVALTATEISKKYYPHQHVLVRNGFSREQVCSSKMEEIPECIDADIPGGVDVLFSPSIARL